MFHYLTMVGGGEPKTGLGPRGTKRLTQLFWRSPPCRVAASQERRPLDSDFIDNNKKLRRKRFYVGASVKFWFCNIFVWSSTLVLLIRILWLLLQPFKTPDRFNREARDKKKTLHWLRIIGYVWRRRVRGSSTQPLRSPKQQQHFNDNR